MFEEIITTKGSFRNTLRRLDLMLYRQKFESQTIYMTKELFLEFGGYDGIQELLLLTFELVRIFGYEYDVVFSKPQSGLGFFCRFNLYCDPELHPATYDFDIKVLPFFDLHQNSKAFVSLFNHLLDAVLKYEMPEEDNDFPLETKLLFDFTAKIQKAITKTLQINICGEDFKLGGAEFKNNHISLVVWDRPSFEDEMKMYRFCLFPEEFYLRDTSDSILFYEKKI